MASSFVKASNRAVSLFPSFRDDRDNCDRAIRGGLTGEHGLELHQMTDSGRIGFSKNS